MSSSCNFCHPTISTLACLVVHSAMLSYQRLCNEINLTYDIFMIFRILAQFSTDGCVSLSKYEGFSLFDLQSHYMLKSMSIAIYMIYMYE